MMLLDVFLEGLFEMDLRRVNSEEVGHAMNLVLEEANERIKQPMRKIFISLFSPRVGGEEGDKAGVDAQAPLLFAKGVGMFGSLHFATPARGVCSGRKGTSRDCLAGALHHCGCMSLTEAAVGVAETIGYYSMLTRP
jgi:hypothetical protein